MENTNVKEEIMNEKNDKKGKFKKFKKNRNGRRSTGRSTFSKGNNDISWYAKDPLLLKMSSIVNFLKPIGQNFDVRNNPAVNIVDPGFQDPFLPKSIPGVCSLKWFPIPGIVRTSLDAINVAMAKLFTRMRVQNFSLSVYDPADVMFYILSWDSVFTLYAWMTLIYAHAQEFKFTNRYYPKTILTALGVDYDDIVDNLDALAFYINYVRNKINVTKVPKSIDFIARHMHMSAKVYKDAEIEKSQLYVFTPQFVWKYNATVPKLEPVQVYNQNSKLTYAQIKTLVDSVIDPLINDEDMNIIAADIQKFVGGDVWEVNPIDWQSQLEPEFDKEMLFQIHNADFIPYSSAQNLDITQTVDANLNTILHFDPTFTTNEAAITNKRIIDSSNDDPSPEEVVESTRLKFVIEPVTLPTSGTTGTAPNFNFKLKTAASELIANASILYMNDGQIQEQIFTQYVLMRTNNGVSISGGTHNILWFDTNGNTADPNTGIALRSDAFSVLGVSAFDYLPIRHVMNIGWATGGAPIYTQGTILGEIGNLAIIEDDQLKAINDMALLSLLDIGNR